MCFFSLGKLDNKLLWRLAEKELDSKEQFKLGVFLEVETSTIRDIMRDADATTSTFGILEVWRDNRKNIDSSNAMYDQLCGAYVEVKKADIVDYVRSGECQSVFNFYYINDTYQLPV